MMNLNNVLDGLIRDGTARHIVLRAGKGEQVLCEAFRGEADRSALFDMASITKIMVTAPLILMAVDRGLIKLDDPVSRFFKTDRAISIKQLLTHTSGIGNKALWLEECDYGCVGDKILSLPPSCNVGTDVIYSCLGFILLGKIAEKIFGDRLDACFERLIARPLGLKESVFLPENRRGCINSNTSEELRGMVNDENCRFLGGVAGNAGLFSSLDDVTRYVNCLLDCGAPLLTEKTFDPAVQNYTAEMSESRALGFLYVDGRYTQTGGLFNCGAIGHCGHTGQSVFVDKVTGLYVIILSDATASVTEKFGFDNYAEVIKMRTELHAAVKRDLEEG